MSTEIQYFKYAIVQAMMTDEGVLDVKSTCLGPYTVNYSEENLFKVIGLKRSLPAVFDWSPGSTELLLAIDETESDYRIRIIIRDGKYDYPASIELVDSRWRKDNFEELATIKEFAYHLKKILKKHFEKEGIAVRSSFSWKGITS